MTQGDLTNMLFEKEQVYYNTNENSRIRGASLRKGTHRRVGNRNTTRTQIIHNQLHLTLIPIFDGPLTTEQFYENRTAPPDDTRREATAIVV